MSRLINTDTINATQHSGSGDFIRQTRRLIIALTLFMIAPNTLALESDRQQPITIQADSAELDEGLGRAIYSGNVQLEQGTLKIDAQQLTVFTQGRKVQRVLATGSPANYTQVLEEGKAPVNARANVLEYLPNDNKLELTQNAVLTQGENKFQGQRIEYFIDKQILNAHGRSDDEPGTSDGRVRMVLPPTEPEPEADSETEQ